MELKFTNKTEHPQQIILVDGSAKNVASRETVTLGVNDIFSEELFRLKNFFDIEEIPVVKEYKKPVELKIETKEGGTE